MGPSIFENARDSNPKDDKLGKKRERVAGTCKRFFFFFENETYIAKQSRGYKRKPAKQEREAYQIEQLDLKKGG